MKKIIKVTSIMGIATCVKIVAGLLRAKFLAWQLGPAGVGILGQATMFWTYAIQLCSLNVGIGITKEISEGIAHKDDERVRLAADTGCTLQFFASIAFILIALPFSVPLSEFIFSDRRYWPYFAGITLATPFAVYLTGVADPILYGFKKVTEVTKLTILHVLMSLSLLLVLVFFFHTEGAMAQIVLISVVGLLLSRYFLRKGAAVRLHIDLWFFKKQHLRAIAKALFQYGFISFVPANIGMFLMLYLRGLFMKRYGVDANGFFQVAYAMSSYYLPFVTNALWGHFYPEMCSLKKDADINRELNQFIRFTLFASTAIAFGVIIFRRYLIMLLFSDKFLPADDLLAIQATGDIFFVLFCMFSTALMARRKFAAVLWIATIGYNAALLGAYYCICRAPEADFRSLNAAIAFANFLLVVVHVIYARFDTGFIINRANGVLAIKVAVFLAIACVIPDRAITDSVIKLCVMGCWFAVSVSPAEGRRALESITSLVKRRWRDAHGG